MRVGSLFSGIGGFDLAARWVGWTTSWYSEIEPYACAVMRKRFPEAVNLGDITQITNPPPIDILVGGFPCQDISLAGKGAGIEGERSGLWSHYARLIKEAQPQYAVIENVSALRSRGLDRVLRDLMEIGYDAEWHCIPACAVGAPHQRDRIWIVAHPNSLTERQSRHEAEAVSNCRPSRMESGGGSSRCESGETLSTLADSLREGLERLARYGEECGDTGQDRPATPQSLCGGTDPFGWWLSEPNVGRVAHGVPARVDRTRCIGNAIVPQVAFLIYMAIAAHRRKRYDIT